MNVLMLHSTHARSPTTGESIETPCQLHLLLQHTLSCKLVELCCLTMYFDGHFNGCSALLLILFVADDVYISQSEQDGYTA